MHSVRNMYSTPTNLVLVRRHIALHEKCRSTSRVTTLIFLIIASTQPSFTRLKQESERFDNTCVCITLNADSTHYQIFLSYFSKKACIPEHTSASSHRLIWKPPHFILRTICPHEIRCRGQTMTSFIYVIEYNNYLYISDR